MAKSQNGWPASANPSSIGVKNFSVPGTSVNFPQGIKSGDVATVLLYVATQFHKNVEALHDGWCWGYAWKQITDGGANAPLSNHASGTAIDLNAPKHPQHKAGSFSEKQVIAIKKILSFCEGVVRWGGLYTGSANAKDEMHFEINANATAVARVAAKIKSISPATKVVEKGDTGTDVVHIQQFFKDVFPAYKDSVDVKPGQIITVDGDFGDQTEAWVKEFQKRTSLEQDGVVGPKTFAEMRKYGYKY